MDLYNDIEDLIKDLDPLQCSAVDTNENNVIITREEFFKLREKDQYDRFEQTWDAILNLNNRVKANYDQGVLNGVNIVNLTGKVEGVNHKVDELGVKVKGVYNKVDELDVGLKAVKKRCQILRQRMMEEIPGMNTVEIAEPTHISPSHEENIITKELADICANSIVTNYNVSFRDNTSTQNAASIPSSSSTRSKKSNRPTVSRKVSSNPNNPPFSCEICGQEYILKASLTKHKSRKHSLTTMTSRAGSGENRPRVEKRFSCSHCNKEYAQAKSCANHELVCSKKTAQPSATASATKDVSPIPESGKNVQTSKRFGGKGQPGKTSSRTDSFNCLFCKYWAYKSSNLKSHVEKYH